MCLRLKLVCTLVWVMPWAVCWALPWEEYLATNLSNGIRLGVFDRLHCSIRHRTVGVVDGLYQKPVYGLCIEFCASLVQRGMGRHSSQYGCGFGAATHALSPALTIF